MTFAIVDNTKDLDTAQMTPLLIKFLLGTSKEVCVIRETHEFCNLDLEKLEGIILSGGPLLLSKPTDLFQYSKNIVALVEGHDIPILGICFGFQVMASVYGGEVASLVDMKCIDKKQRISISSGDSVLFRGLGAAVDVYQWHSDHVRIPPPDFKVVASSIDGVVQGIESVERLRFGVQFHPEATHDGLCILENFVTFCEER